MCCVYSYLFIIIIHFAHTYSVQNCSMWHFVMCGKGIYIYVMSNLSQKEVKNTQKQKMLCSSKFVYLVHKNPIPQVVNVPCQHNDGFYCNHT